MGFFEGTEGTPQTTQWNQNPQYSNVPNAVNSMWDYISKGLQSIQAGQPPTWFQQFRPIEEKQRRNALLGSYYGDNASGLMGAAGETGYGTNPMGMAANRGMQLGQRFGSGILKGQQSADIKAGRRGAGAGSNMAKQFDQYAKANMDITDYMSKLGADAMQQGEGRYLGAASTLPQGPQGAWNVNPGSAYQPSGFESMMQGFGNILGTGNNFSNLIGGLGKLGGQQAQTSPWTSYNQPSTSLWDQYGSTSAVNQPMIGNNGSVVNQFSPTDYSGFL